MPTADDYRNYIDDCEDVFRRVKAGFRPVSDEEQYGMPEDWRLPPDPDHVRGDCDDFAIACRALLREKDYKPRLLQCQTETGVGHLICVLGKVALDNRMRAIEPIERLVSRFGYTLISISGTAPGDDWHEVKDLLA